MRNNLLILCGFIGMVAFGQMPDSTIVNRLESLENAVPLEYNAVVKQHLSGYISSISEKSQKALNGFAAYDSEMKAIFEKNGVPTELRYACISLTDCDNSTVRPIGREGYFMLTYRVAKRQGLNITNFVDERRDVLKSADAFSKEIKKLYEKSKDWRKALTVYSSSDLEWNKARITSIDSTGDFWTINNALKDEYQRVYPRFVAAVYLANFYEEYGYSIQNSTIPSQEVKAVKHTTFDLLSEKLDIPKTTVATLNPIYKKDIIPLGKKPYIVHLPTDKVDLFKELGDSVYTQVKVDTIPTDSAGKPLVKPVKKKPAPSHVTLIYRVKSGDALLIIADLYDCRLSQLKAWNNLRSSRINVGQRLYVKVPASKKAYYMRMNRMTMAQKRAQIRKD